MKEDICCHGYGQQVGDTASVCVSVSCSQWCTWLQAAAIVSSLHATLSPVKEAARTLSVSQSACGAFSNVFLYIYI